LTHLPKGPTQSR